MLKQQILKGTGGTLYFDELTGRPTSATVSITKGTGTALPTAVTNTVCTVDTVNTTVATWSSSTPKQLTVASATGVTVDRQYLVTSSDGRRDFVRVRGVTGTTVYLYHRAPFDLANGHLFQGTRITYALTAGNAATADDNYKAVWSIVVGSSTHVRVQLYDVVMTMTYDVATSPGLRRYAEDLTSEFELSATVDGDWSDRLEVAREKVLYKLHQHGSLARAMIDQGQLEFCIYEQLLFDLSETHTPANWQDGAVDWNRHRWKRHDDSYNSLLKAVTWYDANEDQILSETEERADKWSVRCRW